MSGDMAEPGGQPKVRWDDSQAKRAHANECALSMNREQFVVSFGVAGAPQAGQDPVVEVTQRVAMTPRVAKQLAVFLDRVLREYEARYGDGQRPTPPPGQKGDSTGTV